jgi:hypothetical protein
LPNLHRSLGKKRWCGFSAASSFTNVMSKKPFGKYPNYIIQPRFFLSLRGSQLVSIPCSENHPNTNNILQCQTPTIHHNSTLYIAKRVVCLNSGSHRNLNHLTVTIECGAQVANRALLVSIHKQQICVTVCV